MSTLAIPWSPRLLLTGRTFRLPVQTTNDDAIDVDAHPFTLLDRRYSARDGAWFLYLRAPTEETDAEIVVRQGEQTAIARIGVCALSTFRQHAARDSDPWPRRWPLGQPLRSSKRRQTLTHEPHAAADETALPFWQGLDDEALWRQLPNAEMPRAHFANVHQGCPQCGTAIFAHGGFYPWVRSHTPIDYRSQCPNCRATFPSNDLANGDFTSGAFADDGYGYFDEDGHLFLFAATYARDQVRAFGAGIGHLTADLRTQFREDRARTLALMLLRYAVEITYLGAVPQFRYGPSEGVETPWNWGQTDWPTDQLGAKGMLRYCIDVPYISETLALAYDTVWPLLSTDVQLVQRAQALGIECETPDDLVTLVEEMLACQLQCCLDGGARSNLPRVSQAVLVLLRALDRDDGQDALEWLYDRGPDSLRTFGVNNFFPDGTPPEATGGYNSIHTDGLFDLEYHLRQLRQLHPTAYPETQFPSLLADPRAARVARAPIEIATIGRSWLQFGDGSAPGSAAQLGKQIDEAKRLSNSVFHAPMRRETLARAAEYTGDSTLQALHDDIASGVHPPLGNTVHDGVGIAIVRTDDAPERAAAGVCYGDATGHRHMDLLDVQLFAHGRVFLGDLGYPQSWASIRTWEAHWATHNSGWGIIDGVDAGHIAGRGRLVRILQQPGIQVIDVAAERWAWNAETTTWYQPGVHMRRLLALLETDDQGVVLIDMMRIRGGDTHWRLCRGCGPEFFADLPQQSVTGTLAGIDVARGDLNSISHPDCAGLAYMDSVQQLSAPDAWCGTWTMDSESALDVHQLSVSAGTTLRSARATAIMGTPEESTYAFRTLSWQREADRGDSTCIDLAFEPRAGESALDSVQPIAAEGTAAGVGLTTRQGKEIRLYWAPDGTGTTHFADGTKLDGALAVTVDGNCTGRAAQSILFNGQRRALHSATRRVVAVALDPAQCTVDVEGLEEVGTDMRLRTPARGRNYGVMAAEPLGDQRWRLTLDVTPLLGRGRVVSISRDGLEIELDFCILARTGYLHDAHLCDASGHSALIASAHNPDHESTHIRLRTPLAGLAVNTWVEAVDFAGGDAMEIDGVWAQ